MKADIVKNRTENMVSRARFKSLAVSCLCWEWGIKYFNGTKGNTDFIYEKKCSVLSCRTGRRLEYTMERKVERAFCATMGYMHCPVLWPDKEIWVPSQVSRGHGQISRFLYMVYHALNTT